MRSDARGLIPVLAVLLAALGLIAAAPKRNWNTVVTVTPAGTHLLGNPDAKVRLTEFVSYTCPHCAQFERQAEAQLRLAFVAGGRGAIEVRHYVRDPVDMTVALLTNCGPPGKFFLNHTAFLRGQDRWIGPVANPSPAQGARWFAGTFAFRTRAIARDLGFYPMMASRGYTAPQVDACLADEALANRLAAGTQQAKELGVSGTPSFAIDGAVLAGTHDWQTLRPQLDARLR